MDGYELSARPFFVNRETHTKLYHGRSKKLNQQVVAKCHDIQYAKKAEFIEEFNLVMNAGMAQARVEHPNTCKILELCLNVVDFEQGLFSLYHILEALEKDLSKEIEERKREGRVPSEAEVRGFLFQTAQALAYAHSKNIAHRDIMPENILKDRQNNYKLIDFDTYFEGKTLDDQDKAIRGTIPYMSPQVRQVTTGQGDSYNPFKADVYSLGLTAISLGTLKLPNKPWPLNGLEAIVRATVQVLGYPQDLHDLLISMLAADERARPTMQQIRDSLSLHFAETRSPKIVS